MSNEIILSICIPTYNRADYLKRCLESIIFQDNFNSEEIEVLVSDNASSDNTQEVVKSFQEKVQNIRYFRNQTNLGAERNILNLLKHFQGKYFFLLTDDDVLLPGSLKKLKQIISSNPECSVFLSSYEVFVEQQNRIYIHHTFPTSKIIFKDNIEDIARLYNASSVASRICIRRNFINLDGFTRHINSMYPCMYLVGYAALKGQAIYIQNPLIRHTRDNKIFWDYPNDYMLKGKIDLIRDLNNFDNKFYSIAFNYLISNDIPNSIIDAILKRPKKFFNLIIAIYQTPQIKCNFKIWIIIISNFIKILSNILTRKLWQKIKLQ